MYTRADGLRAFEPFSGRQNRRMRKNGRAVLDHEDCLPCSCCSMYACYWEMAPIAMMNRHHPLAEKQFLVDLQAVLLTSAAAFCWNETWPCQRAYYGHWQEPPELKFLQESIAAGLLDRLGVEVDQKGIASVFQSYIEESWVVRFRRLSECGIWNKLDPHSPTRLERHLCVT